MSWVGLLGLAISLSVWAFVAIVTKRISRSHTEMHAKYMRTLAALNASTIERYDLLQRLRKYEDVPDTAVEKQAFEELTKKGH